MVEIRIGDRDFVLRDDPVLCRCIRLKLLAVILIVVGVVPLLLYTAIATYQGEEAPATTGFWQQVRRFGVYALIVLVALALLVLHILAVIGLSKKKPTLITPFLVAYTIFLIAEFALIIYLIVTLIIDLSNNKVTLWEKLFASPNGALLWFVIAALIFHLIMFHIVFKARKHMSSGLFVPRPNLK